MDDDGEGPPHLPDRGLSLGWAKRLLWNPAERRVRMPWRLFNGLAVLAIVLAVVGTAVQLVPGPNRLDGAYLPALVGTLRYLTIVTALVLAMGLVSWGIDRRNPTDLGLQFDRQWWADCAFGLGLGVGLPTVVFLVQLGLGWVTVTRALRTTEETLLSVGSAPAWFALVLVGLFFLGVSVFEELLVRGYLLTNIAEGLAGFWRFDTSDALWIATLVTAGLFGVLHASNPSATLLSILNISLFGVLLGLGYVLTDRLGVSIGLHLTWNTTVGAVYGFPVSGITVGVSLLATNSSGPALVTGGSFGPEGGLIALLALVVGLVALWWWVRWAYGDVALREAVAVPSLRD